MRLSFSRFEIDFLLRGLELESKLVRGDSVVDLNRVSALRYKLKGFREYVWGNHSAEVKT